MAWYDTAPIPLPESVRRLGEVLELQGTPLQEVVLRKERRNHHGYVAVSSIGRVGVTVSLVEWNVFLSPPGARRFVSLWDWRDCMSGQALPRGIELSTDESVEWVLGLLEKGELPEIDLECLERMAQAVDRSAERDRWLTPLYTVFWLSVAIGVIVASAMLESTAGVVIGGLALTRMIITTLTSLGVKLWRPKKKS